MRSRLGEWAARAFGWAIVVAVFAWPAVAISLRIWNERGTPAEATFDFVRHAVLLGRSVGLALAAATLAVVLALPITFALTRGRRTCLSIPFLVASVSTLLCSPMVLVFGWQQILSGRQAPHALVIAVWALWGWPIAGALLTAFWSRGGRGAYEVMLLETSATRAFVHSTTGVLRAPSLLCVLVLTAIFLNEYSVPHACGLTVYATELLGVATSSSLTKDTVLASLPLVATLFLLGAGCGRYARASRVRDLLSRPVPNVRLSAPRATIVAVGAMLVWLIPVTALACRGDFVDAIDVSVRAYVWDLTSTIGVAAAAGLTAMPIAWTIGATMGGSIGDRRRGWCGLTFVLIAGFVPGAWVGQAFIAAYNHSTLASIADHWPVIALAQAARFAWVPVLTMAACLLTIDDVRDQASLDGVDGWRRFWGIDWPIAAAPVGAAVVCMMALACGDAVVAGVLRVPDYNPVALLIIEKFHRFEDGILAALSLFLVGIGFAAAAAIAVVSRRNCCG